LVQNIKNVDLEGSDAPIPLPNVSSKIFELVVKYAEYHNANPTTDDTKKTVEAWDAEFMKVEQQTLFDLILVFSNQIYK
jgi:S-phase kinase-associated protein 1